MKTNVKKGIIMGLAGLLVGCNMPEPKREEWILYSTAGYGSLARCKDDGREIYRYTIESNKCKEMHSPQDYGIIINTKTGEIRHR